MVRISHNRKKFKLWEVPAVMGSIERKGSLYKFSDFFRMGTFIDSTHMKL